MGSQRVGHDWATDLIWSDHTHSKSIVHIRVHFYESRKMFDDMYESFQRGKFHRWRNLVGYSPWGCKESDRTEWHHFLFFYSSFWRRKWQHTPAFLPGESHGQRGLVGCSLWGCTESDRTKQLTHTCILPSVTQSIFTALKFPSALPTHLSTILRNPLTSLIFLHLYSLAFSRISYSWNHVVCSFLKLSSFT